MILGGVGKSDLFFELNYSKFWSPELWSASGATNTPILLWREVPFVGYFPFLLPTYWDGEEVN